MPHDPDSRPPEGERETASTPPVRPGVTPGSLAGMPFEVGPYVIRRVLGEGGMGVVLEGEDRRLGRLAAVKVMRSGGGGVERFAAEARVLAMLDHPAICRLYDSGVSTPPGGGQPSLYFAMELLEGAVDIVSYARAPGLSVADRVQLMLPVVEAVDYGHGRGVLHRDIKPDNIMVREREGRAEAKLIDFGIARAMGSEAATPRMTEAGSFIGTARYASPEQLSGRPSRVDRRTDVYALGVVLHELVFGTHPYGLTGEDLLAAAAKMREAGPLRPCAGEHAELRTVLHKAVDLDASRRYQTAGELAADLTRWLNGEPVLAKSPSAVTLAVRRARTLGGTNRPLTRLIAAGIAAVAAMHPPSWVLPALERVQGAWMRVMAPVWSGRGSASGVAVVALTENGGAREEGRALGIEGLDSPTGPGWRRLHARLIEVLCSAGARAIAFDLVFDARDGTPQGDSEFADAAADSGRRGAPVVVSVDDWTTESRGVVPTAWEGRVLWGPATIRAMPGFWATDLAMSREGCGDMPSMAAAAAMAARAPAGEAPAPVVAVMEREGLVRLRPAASGGFAMSAPAVVEVVEGRAGETPGGLGLRANDRVAMLLSTPWTDATSRAATMDYGEVLRKDPKALARVQGSLVLVASMLDGQTPDKTEDPVDGREVWCVYGHASAVSALLSGAFVRLPGPAEEWGWTLGGACAGCLAGAWPRRARGRTGAALGLTAAMGLGSVAAWLLGGWVVTIAHPAAALWLACGLVAWLAPRSAR